MSISMPLILIALAGLVVLVLLLLALIGLLRSRKTSDPNDDPRCGACGCIIADTRKKICPTCGSSLAAAGLVLPFSKKRTHSWTARQAFFKVSAFPLALWTLAITGLAIGATMAIDQWLLPYAWKTTSNVQARPRSRGCQSIVISTLEEYRARGRAQFDAPSARRTSRLELKTDTGLHALDINLLVPSFSYVDTAGKQIMRDRLPTKADVGIFMRASGITIDATSTQEAGIITAMLSNLTPRQNMVVSSRDRRLAGSNLDTTQIAFNGGQWKPQIPLTALAMSISPAVWLLGFIFIIRRQRSRRAAVAAALLAPPVLPVAPIAGDDDGQGGWEITMDDENPLQDQTPPPQLPLTPVPSK